MKKIFLFLALLLIIAACDDKPTDPVILEKEEEVDLNLIKFTPDSINLKPGFSYIIEFTGINFTKAKIDSIRIDNNKLEIIESTDSKIISKIRNGNPGTYEIELYQEDKVFILDKKIIFIPMEYKEPTKDNIYFLPDTIFIDENNKSIQFTLYGTDFEKYKIDDVYLNSKKCNITTYRDSVRVSYQYTLIGNHEISFLYKNDFKIIDKRLYVQLKNSLLNLNSKCMVTLECKNILVWEASSSVSYSGSKYTKTEKNIDINYSLPLTSLINLNEADFSYPFDFRITGKTSNYHSLNSYLSIDTITRTIRYFEYFLRDWFDSWDVTRDSKTQYKFENIPYRLTTFNGNPQIVAEIYGKDVDKCYPLIYHYQYYRTGHTSQSISESAYISRKDSITGKQVNYYPATDSSYIRITIGN